MQGTPLCCGTAKESRVNPRAGRESCFPSFLGGGDAQSLVFCRLIPALDMTLFSILESSSKASTTFTGSITQEKRETLPCPEGTPHTGQCLKALRVDVTYFGSYTWCVLEVMCSDPCLPLKSFNQVTGKLRPSQWHPGPSGNEALHAWSWSARHWSVVVRSSLS